MLLGVSESWFYRGITRADTTDGLHTDTDRRRAQLDTAVAAAFKAAKGLHGSPRLIADLRDLGWEVSEKTVADSMRRQGLVARRIKRRNGLTKQTRRHRSFLTWSNETSPRLRRTGNGSVILNADVGISCLMPTLEICR